MIENTFGSDHMELENKYFAPWHSDLQFKTHQKLVNWLSRFENTKLVVWNPEEHVPFCDNYWANYPELRKEAQSVLKRQSIQLEFMLGRLSSNIDYLDDMPNVTITTWPTYWIHHTWHKTHKETIKKVRNINKLYISLNNRGHYHRCAMMEELAKRDLIRYGHISWHKKEMLEKFPFRAFKNHRMILDDYDMGSDGACQEMLPEHYFKTVFNLVVESTTTSPFLTEKTWSAVLAKKPFIVLGAHGIHEYIKELGFKLYDELFDYSFDSNLDLQERITSICDQIDNLSDKDYKSLYQQSKATVKYNYNKLHEIINSKHTIPDQFWSYDKNRIVVGEVMPKIYKQFGVTS